MCSDLCGQPCHSAALIVFTKSKHAYCSASGRTATDSNISVPITEETTALRQLLDPSTQTRYTNIFNCCIFMWINLISLTLDVVYSRSLNNDLNHHRAAHGPGSSTGRVGSHNISRHAWFDWVRSSPLFEISLKFAMYMFLADKHIVWVYACFAGFNALFTYAAIRSSSAFIKHLYKQLLCISANSAQSERRL